MSKKKIIKWESAGIAFIFLFSVILHLAYKWSGQNKLVSFFSAVNYSPWEQFKIVFWPSLVYALIEYNSFGYRIQTFLYGKAISFMASPIIITILYYLCIIFAKNISLTIAVSILLAGTISSQLISCRILTKKIYKNLSLKAAALILAMTFCFSVFTYFPPKLLLFKDITTSTYGVNN